MRNETLTITCYRRVPRESIYPDQNVYTKIATRMAENGCITGAGGDCVWTARYIGPRSGQAFVDMGPVTAADAAPPVVNGTKAVGVTVNVTRTPRTYMLGMIGQNTWTVNTVATAVTSKLSGGPAARFPIGMTQMPTQEGALYSLTSGSNGPGNFGWLSWTGSNTPKDLADSICTPNNPPFTLPVQFPGDPGKSNAKDVRDCLQQWVDNGATVLIPIVLVTNDPAGTPSCFTGSDHGGGNNFHYCIVALAAFVITGFSQPAVDQITGRFVGTIAYSGTGGAYSAEEGSKLYTIGLAQ